MLHSFSLRRECCILLALWSQTTGRLLLCRTPAAYRAGGGPGTHRSAACPPYSSPIGGARQRAWRAPTHTTRRPTSSPPPKISGCLGGRGVPSVAGVTGGECPGPRRARCPQNVRAQAVVPMGICPESACDDRPRKTSASTDGRRCRRWDQPAGPARGQLPAAVNGFSQTLMSVALQPHAGWIVPCPRRSALTRCCVCTVRRMPRQSASKCRGLRARPALARAAWWAAINSPSPARWAVRASS